MCPDPVSDSQNLPPPNSHFELTLTRWHHIARRLSTIAAEARSRALAHFGHARINGLAGIAQLNVLLRYKTEALEDVQLALALQSDICAIRQGIGVANAQTGIAALLAQQEALNRSLMLLKDLIDSQTPDMIPLTALADFKPVGAAIDSRPHRSDESAGIAVSLIDDTEWQSFRQQFATLQRQRFTLTDQLNDINRKKIMLHISTRAATLAGLSPPS